MINLELEKCILSCLLMDNTLVAKVKNEISLNDFYSQIYSNVFDEITCTVSTVGYADVTNIKSIPLEGLVELMTYAPTTARISTYLTELKELSTKRQFAKNLRNLGAEIENKTVQELKADGLKLISDIQVESFVQDKVKLIDIIVEAQEYLETKTKNATKHFKKWGLEWLDNKTGGVKPGLIYLAARPGVGKSAFALQTALNLAKQGQKIGIFSLEMDRISLFNRLLCNYAEINKDYFDKSIDIPEEIWVKIGIASAELSIHNVNIYDKAFAIEEILMLAQEQKASTGLDILILDYIQLCESTQRFNNTNDRISYISRQLKKFQMQTGVTVIALSQLNRESEQKEFPSLSSLRDSGSLEQDANLVLFLHQNKQPTDEQDNCKKDICLIIAKQRDGENNVFHRLSFYGKTQKFYKATGGG